VAVGEYKGLARKTVAEDATGVLLGNGMSSPPGSGGGGEKERVATEVRKKRRPGGSLKRSSPKIGLDGRDAGGGEEPSKKSLPKWLPYKSGRNILRRAPRLIKIS